MVIIVSSITNNVLTAYSSGLALQAVGIKARRAVSVFIDGVVAISLTIYALFISNFFDALNNFLSLSVAVLGPCVAIYVTDSLLRRNQYDGLATERRVAAKSILVSPRGSLVGGGGRGARNRSGTALHQQPSAGRASRPCPEGCRPFGVDGPLTAACVYLAMTRGARGGDRHGSAGSMAWIGNALIAD